MWRGEGVAFEIASPSLRFHKLFLLPASWPTINQILRSRGRLMSGNVGSDIPESGMVANVGVTVGIASPTLSVQKLFLLLLSASVLTAVIMYFRKKKMYAGLLLAKPPLKSPYPKMGLM
jgi:hypothetical protein